MAESDFTRWELEDREIFKAKINEIVERMNTISSKINGFNKIEQLE